jgi:uncharacterized membrane protein YbaN (DUF454 family)
VNPIFRLLYFIAGLAMLALAVIGAFLPLMPSTIFIILAAWCFGRSSRRIEAWLLDHRVFGPALQAWRENGAIPRKGKIMACLGMAGGVLVFWFSAHPAPWLLLVVVAALLLSAAYIVSRPEPKAPDQPGS